ncbi:MAG: aminoacyl-tRNA hydrolase [Gammaproteobacteria bacterium]|nr:aminoacyl-tRNA hydrolase [Gammaproteobacteria bacterium]
MENSIKLIVGLGNPGSEYEHTRHNAGIWFVEQLAKQTNQSWQSENKFHGLVSKIMVDSHECRLLIPTTYMNNSGRAVAAIANYYKITPEQILIAHDELDIPVGAVRLKMNGGDGGHNGLKDIFKALDSKKFYRLRIGIDRPKNSNNIVEYVLDKPSKAQRQEINQAITNALAIIPDLLSGMISQATQQLHSQ